jgi:hypothetical protein
MYRNVFASESLQQLQSKSSRQAARTSTAQLRSVSVFAFGFKSTRGFVAADQNWSKPRLRENKENEIRATRLVVVVNAARLRALDNDQF